jgi:hypothetical protein
MKTRQIAPKKRDAKPRPRLTERKVIEVLIRQRAVIPCGICRLAFVLADVEWIERDHEISEKGMHEDDVPEKWGLLEMQRYVHGRLDPRHRCHKDKTARDRKVKAKVDRIRGVTGKRRGAAMAGTKASGWKKTMRGQAVRREAR